VIETNHEQSIQPSRALGDPQRRRNAMPYRYWGDPITMLNELRKRQLQSMREAEGHEFAGVYPAVNIYDDGDAFMVRAELPGIDKAKLDITTKGNRLSIRGERSCSQLAADVAFHRRERDMGTFHRVVSLPEHVDASKTTATYKNGILEIVCPRTEAAKAHRVEIA